jgi:ComF family protein
MRFDSARESRLSFLVMVEFQRQSRRLGRLLLDSLLPPRCLACGVEVGEPASLCGACWEAVQFIAPPLCESCGLPFETAPPAGVARCGDCLRRAPPFRRARAVFRYDEASREMILRYKHADRTDATPAFAAWMARSGMELLREAEVIAPVPLHRRRLFARRYNQAALLADALAKRSGAVYWPDLLCRKRNTPSQGRLSPAGRRRNVVGAFAVTRPYRERLKGAKVLLVDDVMTTGATLNACAGALNRGGAGRVEALTLARVIRVSA